MLYCMSVYLYLLTFMFCFCGFFEQDYSEKCIARVHGEMLSMVCVNMDAIQGEKDSSASKVLFIMIICQSVRQLSL